jgi:hypothetical protein
MMAKQATPSSSLVLGMGSGRCGTLSLAQLLNNQPNSDVTHERRPLLPWSSTSQATLVAERVASLRRNASNLVGDVASFYLPYAEEFIRQVPDIRIVVLKRDCDEVVKSFCDWSDQAHSVRADHWSEQPANGFSHDPVWSTIFPKYQTDSREAGIRRYWHEYYQRVEELQQQFPDNIRAFDVDHALNSEVGQRELLTFAGVDESKQVLNVGLRVHRSSSRDDSAKSADSSEKPSPSTDRRKCVILVPCSGQIIPGCEDSLKVLEERGYLVRRVRGYSQIDVARNEIASKAMLDGFEETIWIDADIGFHPDAIEKLRAHDLPIVCGVYAKKGKREFAISVLPGTRQMTFGNGGGLCEIQYAATGFLLVRREVYLDIQFRAGLPICNEHFGANIIPYFMPMTRCHREGYWYLGEDYAFCERARQVGYKIMADTTIRLWHVGNYQYGWEDAGREVERFGNYTYYFND